MSSGQSEQHSREQADFDACIEALLKRYETRGNSGPGLFMEDLTDAVFEKVCEQLHLKLKSWHAIGVDSSGSILQNHIASKHESKQHKTIVGFRSFKIVGLSTDDKEHNLDKTVYAVMKSKTSLIKIYSSFVKMAYNMGPSLGRMYEIQSKHREQKMSVSPLLEVRVAQVSMWHAAFKAITPRVYFTKMQPEKDHYYFMMEKLETSEVSHLDAMIKEEADTWSYDDINKALKGIAGFHAAFVGHVDCAKELFGYALQDTRTRYAQVPELPASLIKAAVTKFPNLLTPKQAHLAMKCTENHEKILKMMKGIKTTLSHGDFTPRNVCLRRSPDAGQEYLCAYDWEFLNVNIPQHDVVQFLIFALEPEADVALWHVHMEYYRQELRCALKEHAPEVIDDVTRSEKFTLAVDLALMEFVCARMIAYILMLTENIPMSFKDKIFNNTFRFLEDRVDKYEFLN